MRSSVLILVLIFSQTFFAQISPVSAGQKLPGKFFVLRQAPILIPNQDEMTKIHGELGNSNAEIYNSVMKGTRKGHKNQKALGLKFCRKNGYESVASVFWNTEDGKPLSVFAVHCLSEHMDHKRIVSKSGAVGCQKLEIKSAYCKHVEKRCRGCDVDVAWMASVRKKVEAEEDQGSETSN